MTEGTRAWKQRSQCLKTAGTAMSCGSARWGPAHGVAAGSWGGAGRQTRLKEGCTAFLCSVTINERSWERASASFAQERKAASPLLQFQVWPPGDAAASDEEGIGRTGQRVSPGCSRLLSSAPPGMAQSNPAPKEVVRLLPSAVAKPSPPTPWGYHRHTGQAVGPAVPTLWWAAGKSGSG